MISAADAESQVTITDPRSSRFEVYDTVAKVYTLFRTLNADAKLAEDLSPMRQFMPWISPRRNDSTFQLLQDVDVEAAQRTGDDKTSIMFVTAHKPGALVDMLAVFRDANVNLSHIDKRPSGRTNWEYTFFVDADTGTFDNLLIGDRRLFGQPEWIANADFTFEQEDWGTTITLAFFAISDVLDAAGRMTGAGNRVVRAGDAMHLDWAVADPALRATEQDVVEVHAGGRARDAHRSAFALPSSGRVECRRLSRFVTVRQDDHLVDLCG